METAEITMNNTLEVKGQISEGFTEILTEDALQFVSKLHKHFNPTRIKLLEIRKSRQAELDQGVKPDFLADTEFIRNGNWKTAPVPADLQDRRVEITGPVDRKMIINALNSGVKVFMADFEDSNSPTWDIILMVKLILEMPLMEPYRLQTPMENIIPLMKKQLH